MLTFDDFEALKRKVERLERRGAEARGALEEIKKRMKAEFGVETLEDAEKLLKELEEKERAACERYTKAKVKFQKKFRKVLK